MDQSELIGRAKTLHLDLITERKTKAGRKKKSSTVAAFRHTRS